MTIAFLATKVFLVHLASFFACSPDDVAPAIFFEELKMGSAEEQGLIWTERIRVDADAEGVIYVADLDDDRIVKLNAEGGLVGEIGGHGMGPADLNGLQEFAVLENGHIIAFQVGGGGNPKFKIFDADGALIEAFGPPHYGTLLSSVALSSRKDVFAGQVTSIDLSTGKTTAKIGVLDRRFEIKKTFKELEQPGFNSANMGDPQYWVNYLAGHFKRSFQGRGLFHFDIQGHVYTASSDRYEIVKWDADLAAKRTVFKKNQKPVLYDKAEIEALIERKTGAIRDGLPATLREVVSDQVVANAIHKAELPTAKHPLVAISSLPGGLLLAVCHVDLVTRKTTADFFDPDGDYLGAVQLPNFAFASSAGKMRMRFRDDHAYTFETDENGDVALVRYRVQVNR